MRTTIGLSFVVGFVLSTASGAYAQTLSSISTYVELELSVRELTNAGLRERVGLLQSGRYTQEAARVLDDRVRVQVGDAYRRYRTTAGTHAAYGTRQRKQIRTWLADHPEAAARYANLEQEFRALVDAINQAGGRR